VIHNEALWGGIRSQGRSRALAWSRGVAHEGGDSRTRWGPSTSRSFQRSQSRNGDLSSSRSERQEPTVAGSGMGMGDWIELSPQLDAAGNELF